MTSNSAAVFATIVMASISENSALAEIGGAERCYVYKLLAPLPDPVGFAGMFAGVLNDRLFAGGGSQFPDKPMWLNGQKVNSDRIFTLNEIDAQWREHPTRLPKKIVHFASVSGGDAIYLVGGVDDSGPVSDVLAIRATGDDLIITHLPNYPRALVYAAAIIHQGRLYVAGGQEMLGSKRATAEVWSLALAPNSLDRQWRREPDLPDGGSMIASMATTGTHIYYIGGVGHDATGNAVQLSRAYRFDPERQEWSTMPAMPESRVGPVTPSPFIEGRGILVLGGYAAPFKGERRDHPGFSRQSYFFDPVNHGWTDGPNLPYTAPVNQDSTSDPGPAPMVAAPGVVWQGHVVVVNGEVRASVRTPSVIAFSIESMKGKGGGVMSQEN